MNDKKQAYLIIAHKMDQTLFYLLKAIDHEKNDIYLHIDKKTKEFSVNSIRNLVNKSSLNIVPRKKVTWGGYSQIAAELSLLETSVKNTGGV